MKRFLFKQSICTKGQGSGLGDCKELLNDNFELTRYWLRYFRKSHPDDSSLVCVETVCRERTFFDTSRREILLELAPRLTQLDTSCLRGQKNCFIILGPRGVGKSFFIKSILCAYVLNSSSSSLTIYFNMKDDKSKKSIFTLISSAVAEKYDYEDLNDIGGDDLVDFLLAHKINVLLVVDEVECLYSKSPDDELAVQILGELHFLGELDGPRPVLVILSGSAAVLRSLIFCIPGAPHIGDKYPSYLRFHSLNNRKYKDLHLKPIRTLREMEDAMNCIAKRYIRATTEAIGSEAFLLPSSVSSIEEMFVKSRGLASWIEDIYLGRLERTHHFNRLFGDQTRIDYMKYMFDAWMQTTQTAGTDIAIAASDFTSTSLSNFRTAPRDIAQSYELMDQGVIYFDDTVIPRKVGFLHPSDIGACVLQFETAVGTAILSNAEKLSLLRSVYASADEVNEWLVFESLAWKSQTIDGLVLNGGIVLRDLVLNEEKNFCLCQDAYDNLVLTDLIGSARHAFYKEFPDEYGSDGLNLSICRASEYQVLLRTQVKMSFEEKISGTTAEKWVGKMKNFSEKMRNILCQDSPDTRTCNIFWMAQNYTNPAQLVFKDQLNCALFIDKRNMLSYWSPRLREFVVKHKLSQYGLLTIKSFRFSYVKVFC